MWPVRGRGAGSATSVHGGGRAAGRRGSAPGRCSARGAAADSVGAALLVRHGARGSNSMNGLGLAVLSSPRGARERRSSARVRGALSVIAT